MIIPKLHAVLIAQLFLTLCFSISAFTSPNQHCEKNNVYFIFVKNVEGFNSTDPCRLTDQELSPEMLNILNSIGKLNQKLADFLNLTVDELLDYGYGHSKVSVVFEANAFGPIASSARKYNGIKIGTFPDWTGKDFNESVYVHELTHYVALTASPKLAAIIPELNETSLFSETFADAAALAITGLVFSQSSEMPKCLGKLRYIADLQSYNYPTGYFDVFFGARRMGKCCEYLETEMPNDRHVKSVCSTHRQYFSSGMPSFSRQTFNPDHFIEKPDQYDRHQIGIPINAFLNELSKELGKDLKALFSMPLLATSAVGPKHTFICVIKETPNYPVTVQASSFLDVFKEIRKSLSPKERLLFDKQWEKHQMSKGMKIAEFDLQGSARAKAIKAFKQNFKNEIGPFIRSHPCIGFVGNPSYKNGICKITCNEI